MRIIRSKLARTSPRIIREKHNHSNSYIFHGKEWDDHKYIAKVKVPTRRGTRWRYFYDKVEYENFLKKNKKNDGLNGFFNDVSSFLNDVGGGIVNFFSKRIDNVKSVIRKVDSFIKRNITKPISSFAESTIEAGKDFVDSLIGNEKKHKYVAKVIDSSGKYRYFYSEEEYQRYLTRQEYQETEPEFMEDVPEYHGEMTMSDNSEKVNPNWPYGEEYNMNISEESITKSLSDEMIERGYDPEDENDQFAYMAKYYPYAVNCALCTLTYELRERGYDVEAKPNGQITKDYMLVDTYDTGLDWIYTVYENPKCKSYGVSKYDTNTISSDENDVIDDISKEPVGSRGEIAVYWTAGGGHSMAYTVDSNNQVTIRDTQTNDTYKIEEILELSNYIRYTRTDNLSLKEECLNYVEYED